MLSCAVASCCAADQADICDGSLRSVAEAEKGGRPDRELSSTHGCSRSLGASGRPAASSFRCLAGSLSPACPLPTLRPPREQRRGASSSTVFAHVFVSAQWATVARSPFPLLSSSSSSILLSFRGAVAPSRAVYRSRCPQRGSMLYRRGTGICREGVRFFCGQGLSQDRTGPNATRLTGGCRRTRSTSAPEHSATPLFCLCSQGGCRRPMKRAEDDESVRARGHAR